MFTAMMSSFLTEGWGDSLKQSAMWSRKIGDLVMKEVMSIAMPSSAYHYTS